MKVLIDIPEKAYNRISEKTEVLYSEMIIANGTPFDGLTNGEALLTIFPKWRAEDLKNGMIKFESDDYYEIFFKSWWNAKWGE